MTPDPAAPVDTPGAPIGTAPIDTAAAPIDTAAAPIDTAAPVDRAAPITIAEEPSGAATSWWGDAPLRSVVGATLLAVGAAIPAGVALGLLWVALAPPVQATFGSRPTEAQLGRVFAGEAVFATVMVVAGAVSAALATGWLRRAGPLAVLGVVLAGLVGSVVAWRVGIWAGPNPVETRTGLRAGDSVRLPLVLHSPGLLLVWSITAAFVTLWIATLSTTRPPVRGTALGTAPPSST